MKSDYASVTDQAGIYAGDGGFVINTARTTSLTGAVIDSEADPDKNKLSTGSLVVKNIENKAEYTSRNVGMSYNHVGEFKNLSKAGQDAVWNTLGKLPNLLPDSSKSNSSTTKSAISNGTIEIRDTDFNMQTLSRDTKDSLNKLDEIFDKKKIEERQELSKLFAKEAFGQLHNWNPTSKEGKAAKAIAHGVVAEVSARMAGNKPGSGFYAGATNEALIGEIQKIAKEKPDVAQTLSALLGAAVNGSLGYSPVTGAAEAQYGTKWNASGVIRSNSELAPNEHINIIVPAELNGTDQNQAYVRYKNFGDQYQAYGFLPGEVAVIQFAEKGAQSRGQEVIINSDRSYSNIDEWVGLVKPLVPILTRSDTEGVEVAADTNNVSSFSPVSSVINNAPKNFATGTLTYVGENAFGKTVEKAYLSVSKPMNNNIRVRDAKMLGGLGGKAYNVGMFGNSFNENNERYDSTTGKVVSTTLDSVNLAHDLELIKTKPKIKPSKNKWVNVAKITTFKLSEAGIKGTAIDTVKEWLDKIDKQAEEVEKERREKARKYWPF